MIKAKVEATMSEEKRVKSHVSRLQWSLFVVAILSLIVAFTGINFESISSWYSESRFPRADYTIKSLNDPMVLPIDIRQSLSVSSEYIVATSVNLKSEIPYLGDPMQLSISFDNKGKKTVEQPRIVVYFADYMFRVWGVWNKSDADDVIAKGCSFEYDFPSIDQKTIGAWNVFVLLYDDAEGVLVSYMFRAFMVTDDAPIPWWQDEGFFAIISLVVIVLVSVTFQFVRDFVRKSTKHESNPKKEKVAKKV